jgi:mevalonate kinase
MTIIKKSFKGSLMICGEHAVLDNHYAIVAPINKSITIELEESDTFIIQSKNKTKEYLNLRALKKDMFFNHITAAIIFAFEFLHVKCSINIISDINSKLGLGSSGAIIAAISYALLKHSQNIGSFDGLSKKIEMRYKNIKKSKYYTKATAQKDLPISGIELNSFELIHYKFAYVLLNAIQSVGSGSDIICSITNSIILYKRNPLVCVKLNKMSPKILPYYVGYKTKTVDVIKLIKANFKDLYKLDKIFRAMNAIVIEIFHELQKDVICNQLLLYLFHEHYLLQKELNVSDKNLDLIITALNDAGIPSKISGSGLGDCAIGFMDSKYYIQNAEELNIKIKSLHKFLQSSRIKFLEDVY